MINFASAKRIAVITVIAGLLLIGSFSIGPKSTGAADGTTQNLPGIDFSIQDLGRLVTAIACWTIQIVLAIMIIALVIAGIRFFLARGEPAATGAAVKNLTWVLVGIAVIMGTNIIIATIANALGADYSYLPLSCPKEGSSVNVVTSCNVNSNDCQTGFICQPNFIGSLDGICIQK
jgi:hypothetical protein